MKYIFLILFLYLQLFSEPIRFAPLPMDIAPKLHMQYSHMLSYLAKETGLEFEFVYCTSYAEIMEKFQNKEIDIVELGPLPYLKLSKKTPELKPFLTFLTQNGSDSYTCKLFTFDKNIASLDDLKSVNQHLYLTSQYSTCGPLMMGEILHTIGRSVNDFNNTFSGTHSNVVLKNLLNQNAVGGVKSTVYANYKHIGLKTLGTSKAIPGFTFAANTKLISQENITIIQNSILKLHPLDNNTDWEITKKWGKNIRYGAVKPKEDTYVGVKEAWERMNNAQ